MSVSLYAGMDTLRVWAEVDLDAVRHNTRALRGLLRHGAGLMAVVKSEAYGHGAAPVAKAALSAGAARLGVNEISEGIALREAGIGAPIQLLSSCLPEELGAAIEYDLSFAVSSFDEIKALADRSRAIQQGLRRGRRTQVHLMADTGMGRGGLGPADVWPAVAHVLQERTLELDGVFTHFSSAEEEDPRPTQEQVRIFRRLLHYCEGQRVRFPVRHAANSAATVFHPDAHLDMVRCGVLLHGLRAWPASRDNLELLPALSLYTRIIHLARRPAGSTVGYNRNHVCRKESLLATLPIGYADGYRRALSGRSNVIVRGIQVPVVGTISMNQIVVDVTPLENTPAGAPQVGEVVTLIGGEPGNRIPVEEIADKSGTIPYVVTTQLGANVERRYIAADGGEKSPKRVSARLEFDLRRMEAAEAAESASASGETPARDLPRVASAS